MTKDPSHRLETPGWVLLPLRIFLGVTFCFAGFQKLANHNFFHAGNPASIQAQLFAYQRTSPIHLLLSLASHFPVLTGLAIALGEIAIGLCAAVGLWTRVAAAGGILVSLILFLSVSFHSNPYYTGSDIVFFFAWIPVLLGGAGGVWSLDTVLTSYAQQRAGLPPSQVVPIDFATVRQLCGSYDRGRCRARQGSACEPAPCPVLAARFRAAPDLPVELARRAFLARSAVAGVVALAGLAAGSLAALVGWLAGNSASSSLAANRRNIYGSSPTGPPTASPARSRGSSSRNATNAQAPGTAIGPSNEVPVGGAAGFEDPATGNPAFAVQPKPGKFVAFSAVCPHAGCTVQPSEPDKMFLCPCHGSEFNLYTGALISGPAPIGLSKIPLTKGPDGQLYTD